MTLANVLSVVVAAPLAAGLMSMNGLGGLRGWQWLFIVEGLPSVLLGLIMMVGGLWTDSTGVSAVEVLARRGACRMVQAELTEPIWAMHCMSLQQPTPHGWAHAYYT